MRGSKASAFWTKHKKPPLGEVVLAEVAGDQIGAAGFEPTTPTTPKWCATKLRYAPARKKLSQRFAAFRADFSQHSPGQLIAVQARVAPEAQGASELP